MLFDEFCEKIKTFSEDEVLFWMSRIMSESFRAKGLGGGVSSASLELPDVENTLHGIPDFSEWDEVQFQQASERLDLRHSELHPCPENEYGIENFLFDRKYQNVADEVLRPALKWTDDFNHHFLGTDHLLLALTESGGVSQKILEDQVITTERVHHLVVQLAGQGSRQIQQDVILPFSVNVSIREAERIGRERGEVGAGLAMLHQLIDIPGHHFAGLILTRLGFDFKAAAKMIGEHLVDWQKSPQHTIGEFPLGNLDDANDFEIEGETAVRVEHHEEFLEKFVPDLIKLAKDYYRPLALVDFILFALCDQTSKVGEIFTEQGITVADLRRVLIDGSGDICQKLGTDPHVIPGLAFETATALGKSLNRPMQAKDLLLAVLGDGLLHIQYKDYCIDWLRAREVLIQEYPKHAEIPPVDSSF